MASMNDTMAAVAAGTVSISTRARLTQASPLRKLAATAEARKKKGVSVYHLNIGQPDLPTAPVVFQTIREMDMKTLAYAPSNGLPPAIAAWKKYLGHHGISVEESDIIVTAGGSEAIIFAMCAICDTDDEIIVFEPFYTNYNGFASIANVKLRPVSMSIENAFHMPPAETIERVINSRTRGIMICNPSNPTGTVYSRGELQPIVDLCLKHNLFLLSDEVYREFSYGEPAVSVMNFPEIADRAILMDSSSKRFNVCGARIGALVSRNKDVIASALKFGMARLSVASVEQLALVPLLENPGPYVAPLVEEFRRRRDVVVRELSKMDGVASYNPEGAFYIVAGLPVKDSERFAKWLIEEFSDRNETVLLAPAQGFYATPGRGTNEVRLAFMLQSEKLLRSLELIRLALKAYKD